MYRNQKDSLYLHQEWTSTTTALYQELNTVLQSVFTQDFSFRSV